MKHDSPGQSALRNGRRSIPGQIYLLTWATRDRRPWLAALPAAREVIRSLKYADSNRWTHTLAFVIMPDHVHWCLELGQEHRLERVVNSVKSFTSNRLRRLHSIQGSFWQDGFHDRAARRDDNIEAMCRYIVANPLRAGIAADLGDFPHWDSIWLEV
ncbi:MAG: transposase [Gammaproteobacteria bacterium HGW-Gammaproteobacteria-8]|nr:MAG: transposase [Gammaproteobacteria bacterium HGW-Gammaproteobacteria-8]